MTFTCNDVDKKVRMITNLHLLMRIYNDLSWIEFHLAISAEDSCAKFSLLACFIRYHCLLAELSRTFSVLSDPSLQLL